MIGRLFTGTMDHIRNKLLAGIILLIPVMVTYLVLKLAFNFIAGLLRPLLDLYWFQSLPDISLPWVSIGLLGVLLYVAGVIVATVIGSRMAHWWNRQVERVPLIRLIYRTARIAAEMVPSKSNNSEKKFHRVVLVDYPRPGVKSIGLVTSKIKGTHGEPMLAVYIPTSPTPNSGYLAIVPEDQVTNIDMAVDESMKVILTAGILAPDSLNLSKEEPPTANGASKR